MDRDPEMLKARTLPAAWYVDPAILERERHAVFGREWLCLGPAALGPGDYRATELCGWNILVLAGPDGVLRGFHNVCRHRAGPLVWEGDGHCTTLVCRYHGWTYELDGRLRQARDFGDAAEFDPDEFGLVPVRIDTWKGLLFVNVDSSAPPLIDWLGSFAEACAELPLEEFTETHTVVHHVEANWKVYADNYLEGYHIPLMHRELNREIDTRRYRVDAFDRWVRHTAPARDGSPTSGLWAWRYPNLALNVYPDGMNVERFLPAGPTATRVIYTYCFRPGPTAEPQARESERLSALLLDEDRAICEAVQRNLASGAYDTGRLSPRHEQGVYLFQRLVRAALDG